MTYSVKEMYYTLQGEGAQAGRPAVFLRFAGCNLWSGREKDRATAVCRFCDTDFIGTDGPGGGKFVEASELAAVVAARWPRSSARHRYVVCTGGEPLLQLDKELINALHGHDFEIAVETNGTILVPEGVDWICVSPKASARLAQRHGNELKLVFPQTEPQVAPDNFEELSFDFFFLQPLDGPDLAANTQRAISYCMSNPKWRLSVQSHKLLGIR